MLLFLDFDGVMHPVGCAVDRYFCHLDLVQEWLRVRPAVSIVISSSWRSSHPLDEVQSYFASDIGHRVVGVTPTSVRRSDALGFFEREAEIREYLARHRQPRASWAALDDQPALFSPNCDRLVVCDETVGLTAANLVQADLMLTR